MPWGTASVRRLAVVRRLCWAIVTAWTVAGACILVDVYWSLSSWVRGICFAAWATTSLVLLVRAFQDDDQSVERVPARRMQRVCGDKRIRLSNLTALVAATAAIGSTVAVLILHPAAIERVYRMVMPWREHGGAVPFRIVVTSGDPAVPRGGTVTLSAYCEPLRPSVALPDAAWLVLETRDGQRRREPMAAAEAGVFFGTLSPLEDFRYRVECGGAVSAWHKLTVIDAAQLTPETYLLAVPPAYAGVAARRYEQWAECEAWEHGLVELHLSLTRPAAAAFVEWRPEGSRQLDIITVRLEEDGQHGVARWPITHSGEWTLRLVTEKASNSVRTAVRGQIRVRPDRPPQLLAVQGLMSPRRRAAAGTPLTVSFRARDDLGLSRAYVECRLSHNQSVSTWPAVLRPSGWNQVEGTCHLVLPGNLPANSVVALRLHVLDNRQTETLLPQETIFPPHGWCELTVDPAAPSLEEQDIEVQQLWLRAAIRQVAERLHAFEDSCRWVLAALAEEGRWGDHHSLRLREAGEQLDTACDELHARLAEIRLEPELAPLAQLLQHRVRQTQQLARDAQQLPSGWPLAERRNQLVRWIERLQRVATTWPMLDRLNDHLAVARHDARWLRSFAAELERLPATPPAQQLAALADWSQRFERRLLQSESFHQAWKDQVAAELNRCRQIVQHDLTCWSRLPQAAAEIRRLLDTLVIAQLQADGQFLLMQSRLLIRKLDPLPAGIGSLPDDQLLAQAFHSAGQGQRLEALRAIEQYAQSCELLAVRLQQSAGDQAMAWQRLAEDCRRLRARWTHIPATTVALLRPLGPHEPMLLARIRRLADACERTVSPHMANLPPLAATACQWYLTELRHWEQAVAEGRWLSAGDHQQAAARWWNLTESLLQSHGHDLLKECRPEWHSLQQSWRNLAVAPGVAVRYLQDRLERIARNQRSVAEQLGELLRWTPEPLLPQRKPWQAVVRHMQVVAPHMEWLARQEPVKLLEQLATPQVSTSPVQELETALQAVAVDRPRESILPPGLQVAATTAVHVHVQVRQLLATASLPAGNEWTQRLAGWATELRQAAQSRLSIVASE